jgi:heme-degrading monooxygenase HmoA
MIGRMWRGATTARDADSYLRYLHRTGLNAYRATPGNRGVFALRRIIDDRAEFMLISLWESEDAIRAFAGPEIERAVFYPDDDRFLIERDDRVCHFEVVFSSGCGSIQAPSVTST